MIGLQETRSFQGGIARVGKYWGVVPSRSGLAGGDVELWLQATLPWDPEDLLTIVIDKHIQIIATGPQFMIVSLHTGWLRLDIVVAHAPHTRG